MSSRKHSTFLRRNWAHERDSMTQSTRPSCVKQLAVARALRSVPTNPQVQDIEIVDLVP